MILNSHSSVDLELQEASSYELNELQANFASLISTKKFENNDFINKPDALAVLDLAESCNIFDGNNYKAAGICFNNIAIIQYKNSKFLQAAENFYAAMDQA